MSTNVFITDCDHANTLPEQEVLNKAGIPFEHKCCKTEEDVIRECQNAVALINQYAPLNAAVFSAIPSLQFVIRYGVGVDNVNLADATRYGVQVCNVPDYGVQEVADHAVALTLALVRKVPMLSAQVKQNLWDYQKAIPIHRLSTQTVGVLGLGRIGSAFAKRIAAFGCRVVGYDTCLADKNFVLPAGVEPVASFDALLAQSDIVSIHCALTEQTKNLFHDDTFKKMKPNAYLINVSRGGTVDEEALERALREKRIAGAGLDVLQQEPIRKNHPLQGFENVLLTPHSAWYSEESAIELKRKCAEETVAFLRGEPLRYPVNTLAQRSK